MFLQEPDNGRQRGNDFRIKPNHQPVVGALVPVLPVGKVRVWLCAIVPALLAATLGWVAAEGANRWIRWGGRAQINPVDAEAKNTALSMAILGATLGMTLGAAGGLSRKSIRAAEINGLVGLLLGAALGAAVPLQLLPVLYRSVFHPPHPAVPSLIHTAMYATIGSVAGLVFGGGLRGLGGALKGLPAGALGAILGAITYNVVHTIAFPLERDLSPLPGRALTRLFVDLCVAIPAIVCIVLATDARMQRGRESDDLVEDDI
jgi:hypothetical protein